MIKLLILISMALILFIVIRGFIIGKIKAQITGEKFDWNKFKSNFTFTAEEGKQWGKVLSFWTNWRHLSIVIFIITCIWVHGYVKGKMGVRPIIDLKGKEEWIKLNEHYLHTKRDGTTEVVDSDKKTVLKTITIRDLGNYRNVIKPIGFVFEPLMIMGYGVGEVHTGKEFGVGASIVKYWNWRAEPLISNRGIYLGTSYRFTEHFGAGIAVGKGYSGDNRGLAYGAWRF